MGKKKQKNVVEAEAPATVANETNVAVEQAADPQPAEAEPTPKKKRNDLMLIELALKYVKHMEKAGKSAGTVASYQLELKTALDHFGAETKVAEISPEQVMLYFSSDRVMKKRNKKAKSPLSIAKTQRVLRLALVWAEGAKLIAKAPLPEDLATH